MLTINQIKPRNGVFFIARFPGTGQPPVPGFFVPEQFFVAENPNDFLVR